MAPTPSSSKSNHSHTSLIVEVLARIRDYPDEKEPQTTLVLQINPQKQSIRVRVDFEYRHFNLDRVSLSKEDDLGSFCSKFVQSKIDNVKKVVV
ncbi:hypothetical protein CerSpe_176830 [Prunus speciosa]